MTNAEYIPFINSATDCAIAQNLYSDATAMRISLESIDKIKSYLPNGPKRWIDASIDGLHHKDLSKLSGRYIAHVKRFAEYKQVADPQFQESPDKQVVEQFIFSVLDYCKDQTPDWISIPQLPIVSDASRNRINKLLADRTKAWRVKNGYRGKLILPAIFTKQNQLNGKTERNKKIASIMTCFTAAGADGVWAIDSSLDDQEGSGKFDQRFPALRNFHEELNQELPEDAITICGPYWGMNLVLWSRGAARFPAVGLGGSYRYHIPGLKHYKRIERLALRPLRRYATASPELKVWLADTIMNLSPNDPNRAEFSAIEKEMSKLPMSKNGRMQIAAFYKSWFEKFSSLPPAGRSLALYQDLSSSYVLGKTLKNLPEKGTARRPERVAQQLMMNCL
jgi:hypothetical protein